jgi:carboxylesterase type B
MGESAGGGSILHHITAFGGQKGKTPFQRAIPQSPFILPPPGKQAQESLFAATLAAANVTSFDALQSLSEDQLEETNYLLVARSAYGLFRFGEDPLRTFSFKDYNI